MNDLTNLFYNLIPGAIFTYIWIKLLMPLGKTIFDNTIDFNITFFLIISLFVGFLIHFIWVAIKEIFENYFLWKKNDKSVFFEKNNKLNYQNQIRFSNFFSDRAALWGNLFVGSFITFLILIIQLLGIKIELDNRIMYIIFALIFCFISFVASIFYKEKEINTVCGKNCLIKKNDQK